MNIDLEYQLIAVHPLRSVWQEGEWSSAEVECECGWKGSPNDYTKHLLVSLGFEQRVLQNWNIYLNGRYAFILGDTPKDITPYNRESYLNLFRSPDKVRKFTKEERKTGVLT